MRKAIPIKNMKNSKNRDQRLNLFVYNLLTKRYYRTYVIRRVILTLVLIICIPILSMLVFPNQVTAEESKDKILYEYFMNIEIQPGDSLWGFAEKYAKDNDYKSYIKEVKEINHIYGSKIKTGDTIVLPYYSSIYF